MYHKYSVPPISTDGVKWHKMPRTSKFSQAATARWILDVDDYMPDDSDNDDDDDDDSVHATITEFLFETASVILLSRRFAEFSGTAKTNNIKRCPSQIGNADSTQR
jgi:hypothetical protein